MSELIEKRNARLKAQADAEAAARKEAEGVAAATVMQPVKWDCAECGINPVKKQGAVCSECKAKHKVTATVEPTKILTIEILEPLFLEIKNRSHNKALGKWMFRNKGFDRSAACDFMDLYRQLKKEGYQ